MGPSSENLETLKEQLLVSNPREGQFSNRKERPSLLSSSSTARAQPYGKEKG